MARKRKQATADLRVDGIENVMTGLGQYGRDASRHTVFTHNHFMLQNELEALYKDSGIARRIVDMLPDEALKRGIECDVELYTELERINAFHHITNACKDARLYGGAILLLLAKDGTDDLAMPLNENALKSIDTLAVYDRYKCILTAQDYDDDPFSETFGEVKKYNLNLINGKYLTVHASRVIRFDGERLPTTPFEQNAYWHASSLQACHDSLKSYLSAQGFSDTIIKEWGLTVLKIKGLFDSYTTNTETVISKRLKDADVSKSLMNMLIMDADAETFERQFSQVTGYADLMLRSMELVSATCGVPMTKLFGRSPEGMNATGDGDAKLWQAMVESYQMQVLQAPLNRLIKLLGKQSEWAEKPDLLEWNFPQVAPLNDVELADVRLKQAQADALYMREGAIDPSYLWHIRHEGGYNTNPPYSLESMVEYQKELDSQALNGVFEGESEDEESEDETQGEETL